MAEPTIDDLLKVAFKAGPEIVAEVFSEPRFNWPDDNLMGTATTDDPRIPHQMRLWAFDKLADIGRDYLLRGAKVSPELTAWGFGVWIGLREPPKRPKNRPAAKGDIKKTIQNGMIVKVVNWLCEQGHAKTKTEAIARVAKAAGLSDRRVYDIYYASKK